MLCLGYRDLNRALVGFPQARDEVLCRAVADRMLRIRINKDRKYKFKSKPFCHAYKTENNVVVLCVVRDKKAVDEATLIKVLTSAMALGEMAKRSLSVGGSTITVETLADIVRTFGPKYVGEPTRELLTAEERSKKKVEAVQVQIAETTSLMRDTMGSMLVRHENVDKLEAGTTELREQSRIFRESSKKLEKKAWCTLCKTRCCLIAVVVILVLVVAGGGVFGVFQWLIPFLKR